MQRSGSKQKVGNPHITVLLIPYNPRIDWHQRDHEDLIIYLTAKISCSNIHIVHASKLLSDSEAFRWGAVFCIALYVDISTLTRKCILLQTLMCGVIAKLT